MRTTTTDAKLFKLIELIAQLRDHIDIYRIIGLNVNDLGNTDISRAFLGYLQKSAQESLAIYFCKIFESSTKYDLNSIPAIIASLPATPLSDEQRRQLAIFEKTYGNDSVPAEGRAYLQTTFRVFRGKHCKSLDQLKDFRDTIGAHSDSKAAIESLPSLIEFEELYRFAKDFYELVSESFNHVSPASVPRRAGSGFIRLIKSMGIKNPKFDFDEKI